MTVEGEVFEVHVRPESTRVVDITWLSGPNPGYGFSARRSTGTASDEELMEMIRGFLSNVNPATGYLD